MCGLNVLNRDPERPERVESLVLGLNRPELYHDPVTYSNPIRLLIQYEVTYEERSF
jgi:hypothetical protein